MRNIKPFLSFLISFFLSAIFARPTVLLALNQNPQVCREINMPFMEVRRLKVFFVSDRGDSEHCVICCTEIHCTVIQPEGVDNQSAIFLSISLQFDLVFKFKLFILFIIIGIPSI